MAVKKKAAPTKKATPKKIAKKRKPRTPPAIKALLPAAPVVTPPPAPDPGPEPIEIAGDDGLTNKQRVFIEQYLICWNQTEAARRAGYKQPEQSGYENMKKPEIRAAIDARLKEHKLSADEVLARLSEQATGSMGDFIGVYIDPDTGLPMDGIDLGVARRAGKLHLIKRLSIGKDGISLEIYDSKSALELLGKHYELFTDKHKHEGEVTANVPGFENLLGLIYGKLRKPGDAGDDGLPTPSVPR